MSGARGRLLSPIACVKTITIRKTFKADRKSSINQNDLLTKIPFQKIIICRFVNKKSKTLSLCAHTISSWSSLRRRRRLQFLTKQKQSTATIHAGSAVDSHAWWHRSRQLNVEIKILMKMQKWRAIQLLSKLASLWWLSSIDYHSPHFLRALWFRWNWTNRFGLRRCRICESPAQSNAAVLLPWPCCALCIRTNKPKTLRTKFSKFKPFNGGLNYMAAFCCCCCCRENVAVSRALMWAIDEALSNWTRSRECLNELGIFRLPLGLCFTAMAPPRVILEAKEKIQFRLSFKAKRKIVLENPTPVSDESSNDTHRPGQVQY